MTQQLYIITFPIRHPLGLQAFAFLFSSFAFRYLSLVGLVGCPFRFGCRGSWSFWAFGVGLAFAASRPGLGSCSFGVLVLFRRFPRGFFRFPLYKRKALLYPCSTVQGCHT